MKTYLKAATFLTAAALGLAACASSQAAATQAPVQDYNDLVSALQSNGVVVEQNGQITQPMLSVTGQQITVDGAPVQVYEYASESVRSEASGLISPDGYLIDKTAVDWAGQPTMWAHGKLLVILVGDYPTALESLTLVLGDPFIPAQPME